MKRILIANRGEIALRIIRACRDAGYHSIAIASDADRSALPAREADECHVLPGNSPRETYLNQDAVLAIAARAHADAVHPGYGFLSENESFAAAVEAAGLTWIGPSPDSIARLGDKVAARDIARGAGAPLLPSWEGAEITAAKALEFVRANGLPVIIKAQNGGGGRGMRIVRAEDEIEAQIAAAQREAGLAFGRSECFIERYIENARHIETQCLADTHGKIIVVSTRDCTLQRRHQKLVEEAPAPFLSATQTAQLEQASIAILRSAGYRGAATCEFLLTPEGDFYFLEVNTRIQVEHPVTEEVTGMDLIRAMFHIAEGGHLADAPPVRGHAIEFRINAEDPWADFKPSPGRLTQMQLPMGPGIRLDFGYLAGDSVPPYYDSMMGKLIVSGSDRQQALERARRAFAEFRVEGVTTIIPFHAAILARPEFTGTDQADFTVHTRWIDTNIQRLADETRAAEAARAPQVEDMPGLAADEPSVREAPRAQYRAGVKAPLSGMIIELCVGEGDSVSEGDVVAIMEAMKMEQPVYAEASGKVAAIIIARGSFVEMDADIMGLD